MGFWPVLIVLVLVLVHQVQTFIGLLCPGGPGRFGCSLQPDEHLPVEEGHLLAFGRGSGAPGHAKLGLLKVLDFMVLWFYYGLFHILILTYVYYISIQYTYHSSYATAVVPILLGNHNPGLRAFYSL